MAMSRRPRDPAAKFDPARAGEYDPRMTRRHVNVASRG